MGKDIEKQVTELLKGVKSTNETKALMIMAINIDENMEEFRNELSSINSNLNKKLDVILSTIQHNKLDTDKMFEQRDSQLSKAIENRLADCATHKKEINKKFENVDKDVATVNKNTEVVSFLSKYPKISILIALGIIFVIGFAIGNSKIIEIFKIA